MKKNVLVALALLSCLPFGCAPRSTWRSDPMIQRQGNEIFEATLEPMKRGNGFFESFEITIKNRTDRDLEIDWNRTQYIHDGKVEGVFAFKGIDPSMLKSKTVPADIVPPKGTLTKEIVPVRTIAWAPLGKMTPADTSRISPGILPPGKSGVLLFVAQAGKEISQRILVEIIQEK